MHKVTRKAILVGAPGEGESYLRGVKYDLENVVTFLRSERGGSYYPEEILCLKSPSYQQLSAALHGQTVDYLFVYFSGHGYTSESGHRMLSLPGYCLADTLLLSERARCQLVLIDACRTYAGAAIGAIPELGDRYDSFDGSPVRALFDQWIAESPAGKIIVHSTLPNTYAVDTGKGGVFSKAWIKAANEFVPMPGYDYAPVFLPLLMETTGNALALTSSHQRPHLVYQVGSFHVPFAVALQPVKPPIRKRSVVAQGKAENGSANRWLLTALALGVVALWSSGQ